MDRIHRFQKYIGRSIDTKPDGAEFGSTFYEEGYRLFVDLQRIRLVTEICFHRPNNQLQARSAWRRLPMIMT